MDYPLILWKIGYLAMCGMILKVGSTGYVQDDKRQKEDSNSGSNLE